MGAGQWNIPPPTTYIEPNRFSVTSGPIGNGGARLTCMDLENDPAIDQRRRLLAQRTRKRKSNAFAKPPFKIDTDAAPDLDSGSSVGGVVLESASPDTNGGLSGAESPSRDIDGGALKIDMDTAASSSVPSEMWIALRRAALHRSLDNDTTDSSDTAPSGAPSASSSDNVATDTVSARATTGIDTASSSSTDVLRTEFDICVAGSFFWSNTADYLTLNRRLLDATGYIIRRQRELVLEMSGAMLEAVCKASPASGNRSSN
jgi:hypothetical protein